MNVQPRKTKGSPRQRYSISAAEAPATDRAIALDTISDSASIQRALSVVIHAVAAGTLDPARAKVLLYGLQIAATNAQRLAARAKEEEVAPAIEQAVADVPAAVVKPVPAATLEDPQAVLDEEADGRKQDEAVAANRSESLSEQAEAETPTHTSPGQGRLPTTCFNSAHEYRSPFRERMLSIQARSAARSAI